MNAILTGRNFDGRNSARDNSIKKIIAKCFAVFLGLLVCLTSYSIPVYAANSIDTEPAVLEALSHEGERRYPTNNWWSDGNGDDGAWWCARFASKVFVDVGLGDLIGAFSRAAGNKYGHGFQFPEQWWDWYITAGRAKPRNSGYIPKRGDLVFFDWKGNDGSKPISADNHVAIVLSVNDNKIRTIDGNFSIAGVELVRRSSYNLTYKCIVGYGDNHPSLLQITSPTEGQTIDLLAGGLSIKWVPQTGVNVTYSLYIRDISEKNACYIYEWFNATNHTVPSKFLKRNRTYNIAVRSTDSYGNERWSVVRVRLR